MTLKSLLTSATLLLAISFILIVAAAIRLKRHDDDLSLQTRRLIQANQDVLNLTALSNAATGQPLRNAAQWQVVIERISAALSQGSGGFSDQHIERDFAVLVAAHTELTELQVSGGRTTGRIQRRQWLRNILQARTAVIQAKIQSRMSVLLRRAARVSATLAWIDIATAALLPILLLVFFQIFRRRMLNPLASLQAGFRLLAENRGAVCLPVIRDDEIGEVTIGFNRMSQILQENRSRLEEALVELGQGNRELRAKSAEVEEFVYAVSHDLRGPLVNLLGFVEELKLDLREVYASCGIPADLDAVVAVEQSLHFVAANVNRLERRICGLLALSRTGQEEARPSCCDLNALVDEVVATLSVSLRDAGGCVEVGQLPKSWIDHEIAHRVIQNIIDNAIKYRSRRRELLIRIDGGEDETTAWLTIRDNGLGLSESAQSRLFLAFQRYHPEVAEGEGLGLITVRRLLERAGGGVALSSREDVGTSVIITLPRGPDDVGNARIREAVARNVMEDAVDDNPRN